MSEVKKCPCGVPLDSNLGPKWRRKTKYCSYDCRHKYGKLAMAEAHPDAYEAHTIANRFITEQQPCAFCGEPSFDRHHPDYGKPLEIVWLCRRCHIWLHRGKLSLGNIQATTYLPTRGGDTMKLTQAQIEMLQKHRESKGQTPDMLAAEVELSAQTIRNIEAGTGHPASVRKLVDGLGIDPVIFYNLEAAK